jgi:hypothetical protein
MGGAVNTTLVLARMPRAFVAANVTKIATPQEPNWREDSPSPIPAPIDSGLEETDGERRPVLPAAPNVHWHLYLLRTRIAT